MSLNTEKTENKRGPDLENDFEDFINELHREIIAAVRNEAFKCHLNLSQMEVLRYVIENKNPTMKEIAQHLNIKPPSVTPIVGFLSEKGLLRHLADKSDSRITRVAITAKASKTLAEVKSRKKLIIKKMFSGLSVSDRLELARILSILSK